MGLNLNLKKTIPDIVKNVNVQKYSFHRTTNFYLDAHPTKVPVKGSDKNDLIARVNDFVTVYHENKIKSGKITAVNSNSMFPKYTVQLNFSHHFQTVFVDKVTIIG